MQGKDKKDLKKIKNILSDDINNGNNDFDIVFLVDATGSMSSYIIAAKEETKNIADELRKLYPEKMFQYGYIFYRDPIDSKTDTHDVIDLTDNVNSLPEQINVISATGGGDIPEDWVGAYKLANEKISWRNGIKVIIHLADAGAHGKLFTKSDKYPEEEEKLIYELDRCAEKGIKIFGYVIRDDAQNSFNECANIYRKKGGSYEILQFDNIPIQQEMPMYPNPMIQLPIGVNPMMGAYQPMQMMAAPPMMMNNMSQMQVNMNFQRNAIQSIQSIMDKH
jgi:Mg-chelatase subunit ChlD